MNIVKYLIIVFLFFLVGCTKSKDVEKEALKNKIEKMEIELQKLQHQVVEKNKVMEQKMNVTKPFISKENEKIECESCRGTGRCLQGCINGRLKCRYCGGTGRGEYVCPACNGSGIQKETSMACFHCKGTGFTSCMFCGGEGSTLCMSCSRGICVRCRGKGYIEKNNISEQQNEVEEEDSGGKNLRTFDLESLGR